MTVQLPVICNSTVGSRSMKFGNYIHYYNTPGQFFFPKKNFVFEKIDFFEATESKNIQSDAGV